MPLSCVKLAIDFKSFIFWPSLSDCLNISLRSICHVLIFTFCPCRYRQIGNAVALPVARALGYALGMASLKLVGDDPLLILPPKFSFSTIVQLPPSSSSEVDG